MGESFFIVCLMNRQSAVDTILLFTDVDGALKYIFWQLFMPFQLHLLCRLHIFHLSYRLQPVLAGKSAVERMG